MTAMSASMLTLIIGQICLHSCMAGVRLAAPLQVLRDSHSAWSVGVLLGLFAAAPVLLALRAGRFADRYGYHRPVQVAVGLTVLGYVFTGSTPPAMHGENVTCELTVAPAKFRSCLRLSLLQNLPRALTLSS